MAGTWRLLPLVSGNAAANMATDEAILRAYAAGLVPPTLRFYTWRPPGVSCGRFQDIAAEVDLETCAELGLDVVRRPTGGRAVLHEGDLTYMIVIGERDGLPAGVITAYLHLSAGLRRGLASLGIEADLHPSAGKDGRGSPACFASPSWYELTVGGRKVAGSAQRRDGRDILQHGAIMIAFDPGRTALVLRPSLPREALAVQLRKAAAGLEEFVPGLTPSHLAAAMAEGFMEALRVELRSGDLIAEERLLAAELEPDYERTIGDAARE